MHKQSVPIQLHSDLFVRSADELMLLQTRSSNRVSVTLRAFESADYRPLPLVLFSHQIGWIRFHIFFLDILSFSLSFSISITRPLFL